MSNDLKEGIDFYFNESGLMVFTKEYHLKRGYCCGKGCQNCPYDYENVADEKRKKLLQKNREGKKQQ
ncbi:MAG TPA: DUF5522 domain-containing protein [Hanamia sp.]|nr:DUF5522 domain-containing protein [Hanamia sp.]